jgi:hypothetical protein
VEQSNLPHESAAIDDMRVDGRIIQLSADEQANETYLLLSSLDLALGFIATARGCGDRECAARLLTQAVESYGSVKGVLPKLGLRPEQMALVSQRLKAVQECLGATPTIRVENP